jgi:hypothetical protein
MKKMKRLSIEWEKIFSSHMSDKDLVPQIYKELLPYNSSKKPNTVMHYIASFPG